MHNHQRFLWIYLSCAMAICGMATAGERAMYRVTMNGYGPIHVGMTTQEVEKAIGRKVVIPSEYDATCSFIDLTDIRGLQGTHAMLLDGRVARLDFDSKQIKTLSGIGIGDSSQMIQATYGKRALVEPHAYTAPEGSYYTIYSKDRKSGVRFETDHGTVTTFYTGSSEAIQLIEGCQ